MSPKQAEANSFFSRTARSLDRFDGFLKRTKSNLRRLIHNDEFVRLRRLVVELGNGIYSRLTAWGH